jgi:hypothetical protein
MTRTETHHIIKLTFTPLIILLLILSVSALFFPYNYFHGKQLTNILAGIFPICLVIFLPIDLLLKVFLSKDLKRLWFIEVIVLVLCALIRVTSIL